MTSLLAGETALERIMGAERILVIEDDRRVQTALKRLFEPEGFLVEVASNGSSGLDAATERPPALVMLDLRLPNMSGRDVCREIKRTAPNLPIIILSAITDVIDKVTLFELGADDYVTKPFSPEELLARVRAALRRTSRPVASDLFSFGDVAIDFVRMELTRAGQPVTLTAQEFKVLRFLTENPERVITREELLNSVWGYEHYPTTRTVDNHMLKLRQKIEHDPANPVHIRTVHGVGYKFVP